MKLYEADQEQNERGSWILAGQRLLPKQALLFNLRAWPLRGMIAGSSQAIMWISRYLWLRVLVAGSRSQN